MAPLPDQSRLSHAYPQNWPAPLGRWIQANMAPLSDGDGGSTSRGFLRHGDRGLDVGSRTLKQWDDPLDSFRIQSDRWP